jgi:putative SOS response-associated peptidase YedK
VDRCAILTTRPNALGRPVHDRMPVTLPREVYDVWLDDEIEDARALIELLRPYPAAAMEAYPVSRRVNNVRHIRPECCEPLAG